MGILRAACVICVLLLVVRISNGQSNAEWRYETSWFVPKVLGFIGQVSSNATYFADNTFYLEFLNLDAQTYDYSIPHYTGSLPRWQNNTMLYQEHNRPENWGGMAECLGTNHLTFGFYNAQTKMNEVYCLVAPQEYVDDYQIDRFPFDDHVALLSHRYLVNVSKRDFEDLRGTLTTHISRSDTLDWLAQGTVWWDPVTRKPMAFLSLNTEYKDDFWNEITSQSMSICPLESSICQPIISVQDYIHGNVYDMILSPDGQTILWSSLVFETGQPVQGRVGNASIKNVAAFATHLQTGATTEIFRLSDHNPLPQSRGTDAIWAEDGQTLAIKLRPEISDKEAGNGILLVRFSRE